MSYHPDRNEAKPTGGIPKPPSLCSIAGCTEHAHLLFIVVLDGSREVCGSLSDFGYSNSGNTGVTHSLRDGYQFVRWIARCHEHYDRDLYRQRKGKWSPITGTDSCPSKEAVEAYQAAQDAKSGSVT